MKRLGLFWRTYLLLLAISLLPLLLVAAVAEWSAIPELRRQTHDSQRWTAETLMSLEDRALVNERLSALRTNSDVNVTLYDKSGTRIAGHGARLLKESEQRNTRRAFEEREVSTYALATGYVVFDAPILWVAIEAIHIIAVAVLAMLLAWPISRSLSQPLVRLQRVVSRFGRGELQLRAHQKRNDEIGQLAHAFDQMADQIVAAMKLEKHIVAGISHELRTPLHRLRLGLELAQATDGSLAGDELSAVERDLSELERLLSEVLAVARVSAGSPRLLVNRNDVGIDSVCVDVAERFRAEHPTRVLVCEIEQELATHGDRTMLSRAIGNLLSNAARYSQAPSPITLQARRRDDQVVIRVIDQGIGISAENLERVFEPFERGQHNGDGKGIGFGLSFVSGVVAAHSGRAEAHSTLGEGSVFALYLPAVFSSKGFGSRLGREIDR